MDDDMLTPKEVRAERRKRKQALKDAEAAREAAEEARSQAYWNYVKLRELCPHENRSGYYASGGGGLPQYSGYFQDCKDCGFQIRTGKPPKGARIKYVAQGN